MPKKRNNEAKSGTTRIRPPPAMGQQVLMEAGYKCGNPACRHILTLELHHIVWVKDGGRNEPSNLLALCANCHTLHTHGHIPEAAIRHWKGMLLALNHAFDRGSMDLLLYLYHTRNDEIWYTGDGVLRFAGLMAAGLVQFGRQTVATPWQITQSTHQIHLSESGISLVEAWLAGDEDKYRDMTARAPASQGTAPREEA